MREMSDEEYEVYKQFESLAGYSLGLYKHYLSNLKQLTDRRERKVISEDRYTEQLTIERLALSVLFTQMMEKYLTENKNNFKKEI
jgi:hypothetical protein